MDFGDSIKGPIYVLWESQRGGRKKTERLFEEIMGKTFQIWWNTCIYKAKKFNELQVHTLTDPHWAAL